jgi:hypothetical protein
MVFFLLYPMATLLVALLRNPRQELFIVGLGAMMAILVALQVLLVFRYRRLAGHILILGSDGLYYEPLAKKFGIDRIPWAELLSCHTRHQHNAGWSVVVHLKPGAFRDNLMESRARKFDGTFEIDTRFLKSGSTVHQDVSDGIHGRLFTSTADGTTSPHG